MKWMNTNDFQGSKPEPVQFSKSLGEGKFWKDGKQAAIQMALLIKSNYVDYERPTRKKATCLWFLSEASCAGVRPVLSASIRSSFLPACTSTVQASKLPLIAAQWRGVQPERIRKIKTRIMLSKSKINSSFSAWIIWGE